MNTQTLNIQLNPKTLLKFAFPTIISNVFMSIYSTVDGIFVSNIIGTDALSAVNIVMPYVMIVLSLGIMMGTGGSAIVAALLGANKIKEARETFSLICLVSFICCTVVSILSLIFCEPLLHFLGANDVVFDYCLKYARPLFCAAPLALLGMTLQSFFITAGKPGLGMTFSVAGGILNVFLDWLLIVRFSLETTGAALATGLGYCLPAVAGIIYFSLFRKNTLRFVVPKFQFNILFKTVTNGSSEMMAMLASGITTVIMNNIIMGFVGEDGVAAISIIIYTMSILTSVYMGYSLGVAPITSFHYGAQNQEHLKKVHRLNLSCIGIFSVIMYLLGLLLYRPIILIFTDAGSNVYNIAHSGYMIFSISFLYMGFNMYASSLFTALGNGKISALISFCRGLIFLSVCLYGLSTLFGLPGLWAAQPIAELLGIILSIYFIRRKRTVYGYA